MSFFYFSSIVTPVMTYGRLESMVDKLHIHLRDQEKHFLYQANQLNVWNHTLIEKRDEVRRYCHWFSCIVQVFSDKHRE